MNSIASKIFLILIFAIRFSYALGNDWRNIEFSDTSSMVTAISLDKNNIAIALSTGGVILTDSLFQNQKHIKHTAFGKNQKVWSLAWIHQELWIASDGGVYTYSPRNDSLDIKQTNVPSVFKKGILWLQARPEGLWGITSRHIVFMNAFGKAKSWDFADSISPTSMVLVGGKVLVGTTSMGVYCLDTAKAEWTRLTIDEGLASDQVTAMEKIQGRIYIASYAGLDVLDLATMELESVYSGLFVSWMTQIQGVLYGTTLEGLLRIDVLKGDTNTIKMPSNAKPEGEIRFSDPLIVMGCRSSVWLQSHSTLLKADSLLYAPNGFRLPVSQTQLGSDQIQAALIFPEMPSVEIPLSSQWIGRDSVEFVVPRELQGDVWIDVKIVRNNEIVAVRSYTGNADRNKPRIEVIDDVKITGDSVYNMRGRIISNRPIQMKIEPLGVTKALLDSSEFRIPLPLQNGENTLRVIASDILGNTSTTELRVFRDAMKPSISKSITDTVEGENSTIRVVFHDASPVTVAVTPQLDPILVLDTVVILQVSKLKIGANSWNVKISDKAGNQSQQLVSVVRRAPKVIPVRSDNPVNADAKKINTVVDPVSNSSADQSASGGVFVIRYRLEKGDGLRKVSKKFYGKYSLGAILIRWNEMQDSTQWRSLPVGTMVEIPFWRDFEHGTLLSKDAIASFPWDKYPSKRVRK